MAVKEYSLKFTQLARYAPHVVANSMVKMSKFISRVNDSMVNECRSTMLNSDISLTRLMTHAQKIEDQKIKMREKQNKRGKTGSFNFPQPKDPLGDHVSHAEFRAAFTTLAQLVAPQNE